MSESHTVVVVGGGISGLVTAASLAKQGIDVLLLEKNQSCGGLVNSFTRDGFMFDGGIRAIENAGMIKPMLDELDIDLTLLPSPVSLGIEDQVIHAVNEESVNDYAALLKNMYPESTDDVDKVIEVIKKFDVYMNVLFGSDSPFFKDKKRDRKYYLTKFFPWIFRFLITGIAITKMQKPVEDFLHGLIDNQSLFDIISQHFFKNTPAFFAMSYFSLYTDYYYPKGGVGQLGRALEEKCAALGGTIKTNTEITTVNPGEKTVIDESGTSYSYDTLIWCADLKYLYSSLNISQLSGKHLPEAEKEKNAILSKRGAESVFTVFLGVDMAPDFFREIAHGHFFYTPSKKGLGDLHRAELRGLLERWDTVTKEEVFHWTQAFCELNTFEVSVPALHDPDTAPVGKTGLIISFLLDYALTAGIRDRGWYDEFKLFIEKTVIVLFSSTIYPGIKDHVLFHFSSSPLFMKEQFNCSEGAIVGWSFEEPVPIKGGILNMKNAVCTALPDIYRAGQWTASPAGLPTCIMTAKMAADKVIKK